MGSDRLGADLTVPSVYIRQVAAQLREMDVDVTAWLEQSGTDAQTLSVPHGRLPFPLYQALLRNAVHLSREPALGLFVGERLGANTHGAVGAAAVNSETVRQAAEVAVRFSRLRTAMIELALDVDDDGAWIRFEATLPLGDIEATVLEAVILGIKRSLDEITFGQVQPHEAAFPFPKPTYSALARDMFACPVSYGRDLAGLRLSPSALDVPIRRADPAIFEEIARVCDEELNSLEEHASSTDRIRRLMLKTQRGFPSLQVTARHLNVTARTLHRRLAAEGTSYRELLESVRQTLATEHLKSERLSVGEIAFRLGYSDLANFRRAFKRWEGMPPTAYRKQHAGRFVAADALKR